MQAALLRRLLRHEKTILLPYSRSIFQKWLGKRLVSIVEEAGVGRSSMACALCHYINERSSTILEIEQIYFVKVEEANNASS